MLCSIKTLEGCAVASTDGDIGHVEDFFFDDQAWVIRHLVVDCGHWLPGRKVLISPHATGPFDRTERELRVSITKDQVRHSPDVDTDMPISRQGQVLLYGLWIPGRSAGRRSRGTHPEPVLPGYEGFGSPEAIREEGENAGATAPASATERHCSDPHLRSCREVLDYLVGADDGEVGHVDDLLVDDQTWTIRYLVVNTNNWWFGHRVLISPTWIRNVSWVAATVSIELSRDAIRRATPYDPAIVPSRALEAETYRHYARQPYWDDSGEQGQPSSL